jgi:hypothetical protein
VLLVETGDRIVVRLDEQVDLPAAFRGQSPFQLGQDRTGVALPAPAGAGGQLRVILARIMRCRRTATPGMQEISVRLLGWSNGSASSRLASPT